MLTQQFLLIEKSKIHSECEKLSGESFPEKEKKKLIFLLERKSE